MMNGHTDSVGDSNRRVSPELTVKKVLAMPKEINILGMSGRPPMNKLPKIPKIKSSNSSSVNKKSSPLKSPTKVSSKTTVKTEPQSPIKSPKKPIVNGSASSSELKKVKKEDVSDDDEPLSASVKLMVKKEESSSDREKSKVKLMVKKEESSSDREKSKVKKEKQDHSRKRKATDDDEDDFKDHKPKKKKDKKHKHKRAVKEEKGSPKKKVKKEEEEVWRWWDEEPHPEGIKWKTLEHQGPFFPPPYDPLPGNVKFYYDGKVVQLSEATEEVATFYAKMLEHDYTKKDIFNNNFFEDWRKEMTHEERKIIKDLSKCDFKEIAAHFAQLSEERKNMTKEQKTVIRDANAAIADKYGFCIMDGHQQKVGNFRIEPPGLFRGRGDHPKQGKLKKRAMAKDIIINIGKRAEVPEAPEGQKWKAVQYDNSVTWLACWNENIAGNYKYVMLNAATRLKGEKDWQKYEIARTLKECVSDIRNQYRADWKSKEMRLRQRGVAMYFIDKLALRAGHEKEEGESADTVGCCSLRVEHITLQPEKNGQDYVVEFDFLGKDSIRYTNDVPVEKRVFKNLELFMQGKQAGDDLFDRLSTASLNKFLGEQMPGLTAKVFRTYNASITLQDQLQQLTNPSDDVMAKFLSYNRANRQVAILCNHQRAAPKTFDKQMENLVNKLKDKKKQIKTVKKQIKELKREYHDHGKSERVKNLIEKKKNQMKRLEQQYFKLEVNMTDKEENKEIALGTSKLNYLDPRISVAWCKKYDVPLEKVYNKTQREKFQWAVDMTEADFVF